jgi:membrane protein
MSRTVLARLNGWLTVLQATRPWRAWARYGAARGNVLAGGIAYFAFLSLVPALALGFTVAGWVLGGSQTLQREAVDYLNSTFGSTVIGITDADGGLITMDRLVQPVVLRVSGLVGLVVLLVTGLGWIDALRQGIRAMFGLPDEGNPVRSKVTDLGVMTLLGLSVLTSASASVAITAASSAVLDRLAGSGSGFGRFLLPWLIDLALVAFDAGLLLLVTRVLAGVPLPAVDLAGGALLGAVGLFALKIAGALGLKLASGNRLLAGASVIVGLLVWFDIAARITLISAAWSATTATDRGHQPGEWQNGLGQAPEPAEAPGRELSVPTYGVRAADRTSVLAGAVLGAAATAALGLLSRAGRTARGVVARDERGR